MLDACVRPAELRSAESVTVEGNLLGRDVVARDAVPVDVVKIDMADGRVHAADEIVAFRRGLGPCKVAGLADFGLESWVDKRGAEKVLRPDHNGAQTSE